MLDICKQPAKMTGFQIQEISGSLETGQFISLIQPDLEESLKVKQEELMGV